MSKDPVPRKANMSHDNLVSAALAFCRQLAIDFKGSYHPDGLPERCAQSLGPDEHKLYDAVHQYLANRMVDIADHLLADQQHIVLVVDEYAGETWVHGQPTFSLDGAVDSAQKEVNRILEHNPTWKVSSSTINHKLNIFFWCLETGDGEPTYSFEVITLSPVVESWS